MSPKETPQLAVWRSEFGKAYTDRNKYGFSERKPAFRTMLENLEIVDILEIGCNFAGNLQILAELNPKWQLTGIEPNKYARSLAPKNHERIRVLPGNAFKIPFPDASFDLVFTANVLIHIALADLPEAIHEIYRSSRRYILAIEYFSEQETEIFYHGHKNTLWKRDFRKHFEKLYPSLNLVQHGFWDMTYGFDDSTWWLWEK